VNASRLDAVVWKNPGTAEWVTINDGEGAKHFVRQQDSDGNDVWYEGRSDQPGTLASSPYQMTAAEFRELVEASLFEFEPDP
jgi:hypothetical protein